jgi:hypothetical protein
MKTNKVNSITKALALVSVFACAALALLASAYFQTTHKLAAAQQEGELTSTLVEATRYHVLLKEINAGELDKAKTFLASAMQFDLAALKPMTAKCENPRTQAFAAEFSDRIVRAEGKTFLVASQRTGFAPATVTPVVAH